MLLINRFLIYFIAHWSSQNFFRLLDRLIAPCNNFHECPDIYIFHLIKSESNNFSCLNWCATLLENLVTPTVSLCPQLVVAVNKSKIQELGGLLPTTGTDLLCSDTSCHYLLFWVELELRFFYGGRWLWLNFESIRANCVIINYFLRCYSKRSVSWSFRSSKGSIYWPFDWTLLWSLSFHGFLLALNLICKIFGQNTFLLYI